MPGLNTAFGCTHLSQVNAPLLLTFTVMCCRWRFFSLQSPGRLTILACPVVPAGAVDFLPRAGLLLHPHQRTCSRAPLPSPPMSTTCAFPSLCWLNNCLAGVSRCLDKTPRRAGGWSVLTGPFWRQFLFNRVPVSIFPSGEAPRLRASALCGRSHGLTEQAAAGFRRTTRRRRARSLRRRNKPAGLPTWPRARTGLVTWSGRKRSVLRRGPLDVERSAPPPPPPAPTLPPAPVPPISSQEQQPAPHTLAHLVSRRCSRHVHTPRCGPSPPGVSLSPPSRRRHGGECFLGAERALLAAQGRLGGSVRGRAEAHGRALLARRWSLSVCARWCCGGPDLAGGMASVRRAMAAGDGSHQAHPCPGLR